MFRNKIVTFMVGVLSVMLLSSTAIAKEIDHSGSPFAKSAGAQSISPRFSLINIGGWGYWYRDDGQSAHEPGGNSGGIYPRGTAGAIYLDGLLWGGLLATDDGDVLKLGGQTYDIGTQSGYIGADGYHVGPTSDSDVRLYRVRRDYATLTYGQVRKDAAEQNGVALGAVSDAMCQEIIDNYTKDWAEWPAHLGAPYDDVDEDGSYDPLVDVPGIASSDQCIWFVVNDLNEGLAEELYATSSSGIEQQNTIWAYNQPGSGLGQIVFKQYRLINKNRDGNSLKEMYVSIMSDPDLGDYSDDYVGCDTTTSLGFAYNSKAVDDQYLAFDLAPAAVGYDFFAGPIVPSTGDTAIFNLEKKADFRNLPLTSFTFYSASSTIFPQPPGGVIEGAYAFYNLMQGFSPKQEFQEHVPFQDDQGVDTKFIYAGDPVTGEGHLDANAGDRRMVLSSGPFTLAYGDTQDIVVAVVGGISDSYLTSITDMRNNDIVAQKLFDDLFQSVPTPPPGPIVKATPLEDQIVITWGFDPAGVSATEDFDFADYSFQGYNLYQLPDGNSGKKEALRIGTFDLIDGVTIVYGNQFLPEFGERVKVPVQFGNDQGVKYSFIVDQDYFSGGRLLEGREYYFAVTAYAYNGDPQLLEDMALESGVNATPVTVQEPQPGVVYGALPGEQFAVTHSEGPSQGVVSVTVSDPEDLVDGDYEVYFHNSATDETDETTYWALKKDGTVISTENKQMLTQAFEHTPQIDGLKIVVSGPIWVLMLFRFLIRTLNYLIHRLLKHLWRMDGIVLVIQVALFLVIELDLSIIHRTQETMIVLDTGEWMTSIMISVIHHIHGIIVLKNFTSIV